MDVSQIQRGHRRFRPLLVGLSIALTVCTACSGATGGKGAAVHPTSTENVAATPTTTAPSAPDPIVDNGSFELPVVTVGNVTLFTSTTPLPGWQVVGAPGNVGVVSASYGQGGLRFPAAEGAQWMDLTGLTNTATGITQAIATSPGAHYTLGFQFGNIVNPGGVFGTTSSVEVSVNGQVVRTVTNALGAGQGVLVWQDVSVNFTASSASTTISFLNRDPGTDNSNGIDAVTVVSD